ncbi:hypothetical protein LOTGIDRAFT_126851 [Lottia gigantea]|uniref:nicotinamidase n=1 Tax=Lottia gigantea TaxID=225164 RepID=V4BHF4_LOTGI|nr:hypothetical protein LOTGIDRAFT_126851 [Lottia gigantea]ESO88004.1 hypothetical protein LOTGIDRAFT_126851 [Lottia gigantea]
MVCTIVLVSHTASQFALIIIDVQECFLSGGSLAVTDGNQVIPVIKRIRDLYKDEFNMVVFTQDWHCENHVSFASQFSKKEPYDTQITQTLWPDHCIKDVSSGPTSSKISEKLKPFPNIVKKGQHCQIDAYSAFNDNGNITQTELNELLRKNNITTVFITGLALDYCVYYTALDAVQLGYTTYIIRDASRGVAKDTTKDAVKSIRSIGSAGHGMSK